LIAVPVEFLSDEQAAAYGCFAGAPSRAELERFFFLDDADRRLVDRRRGDHNRLGFALQLGTVRFLGTFLENPLDVPWPVVEYLAGQLRVVDASVVKGLRRADEDAVRARLGDCARLRLPPADGALGGCGAPEVPHGAGVDAARAAASAVRPGGGVATRRACAPARG
jgi:Domain of unknown function (DUF4158)